MRESDDMAKTGKKKSSVDPIPDGQRITTLKTGSVLPIHATSIRVSAWPLRALRLDDLFDDSDMSVPSRQSSNRLGPWNRNFDGNDSAYS